MDFPLVRTRRWRRSDTWEALWGLVLLAAGGYWLTRGFIEAPNGWLRAVALLGGVAFLALALVVAWLEMKETFGRPGRIELTSSEIVVDSPKWFRSALRAPLSQVRLVSFDESSGEERRFPIAGARPESSKKDRDAWLWRKDREGALPNLVVNPLDEVPNLALVFDPPVEIRGQKTLKTLLTHAASFWNRRIRVVTALIDNGAEAKAAFDRLGLLRNPTITDIAALRLTPEEKREARRYDVIAVAIMILLLCSWIGGVVWYVTTGE